MINTTSDIEKYARTLILLYIVYEPYPYTHLILVFIANNQLCKQICITTCTLLLIHVIVIWMSFLRFAKT